MLLLGLVFLLTATISTITSTHPRTSFFGEFDRYEGLLSWLCYLWLFYMSYAWFTDVDKASWEFGYVETARAHGVIGGYKDGTFKPNKNITRAEIAKIIAGTLNLPAGSSALSDIGSSWAKDSINSCVKAGIIKGYSNNTFRANNTATRAEAANMITGMLDAG